MALSFEKDSWLIDQMHHFEQDPDVMRKGFETDFMADLSARFKEEGVLMFVSGRMMNILRRLGKEKFGMDWDDYRDD